MSQDIQLSSMNPLPMHGDFMPMGGNMPSPGGPSGNPLAKLHRLLRGRYPLVIILALIFGAVGGAIGFYSQKPGYTATGIITVSPFVKSLDNMDRILPMFNAFMRVQEEVLRSPRLIQLALNSHEWKSTGRPAGLEGVGAFSGNLIVDAPSSRQGNYLITIAYTDLDPAIASTGVKVLVDAYKSIQSEMELSEINKKISMFETRKNDLDSRINILTSQVQSLGMKYGTTDLSSLQNTKLNALAQLQTQLNHAKIGLDQLTNGGPATTRPAPPELTAQQVAKYDSWTSRLLNERNMQEMQMERLKAQGFGERHPSMISTQRELQLIDDQIAVRVRDANKNPALAGVNVGADGVVNNTTVDAATLRQNINRLEQQIEIERKDSTAIAQVWMDIQGKQNEIGQGRESARNIQNDIEALDTRRQMMGRVEVLNDGASAAPTPDKRSIIAAAGAFGGMVVPVGLMMLIGLMDSRLRYSDETDTDLSGITLLGILPNLPDRLSDPEQAATAAHCVHQIRTMLQINGAAMEQSVFAVTSASPGDGKTSLTLALGLSFAACGSRTLLIDCDLIGAGLTRRLGIASETGILEAAAHRTVLEHIRTTDITDVAILPVGASGAMHASTLSPNALRRIIQESKKHFDVILIDTGPILGSIEASLVATVADGIVLTVARGQHRQIVEKSLRHLMSIGAKIAGVVFNRAQARDFERSLSNVSMRSLGIHGTAPVDGPNRYGPLGHAVQGQYTNGKH